MAATQDTRDPKRLTAEDAEGRRGLLFLSLAPLRSRRFFESSQKIIKSVEMIARYFSMENKSAEYTYGFGDDWGHRVLLEKILPKDEDARYPVCIKGKRACPPEDCGGVWGYEELLEALHDPDSAEDEELLEWLGVGFDPEYFDAKAIYSRESGR